MAISLSIVDTADTTPDDVLFAPVDPCAAPVQRAAFAANHAVGESILGRIAASAAGRAPGASGGSRCPCR